MKIVKRSDMTDNIAMISAYLDNNSTKYPLKVFKCGHVISVDQFGNMVENYQQLVDGTEYYYVVVLIADVARMLGVPMEMIVIVE